MLDWTRLLGARAVTITGSIVPSSKGSRAKTIHALAPFLDPGNRPVLTYQVDADVTPRTMTLRPAAWAAPVSNPHISAFQLGYKAPDPLAYDSTVQTATTWAASSTGGRVYNLTFNRVYPSGGSTTTQAENHGDQTVYPMLHLYGPITGAIILETGLSVPGTVGLTFQPDFILNAGSRVDIDCKAHTAIQDGITNVYSELVYTSGQTWPFLPPGVVTTWTLSGSNTSTTTQLGIVWQDGYLL